MELADNRLTFATSKGTNDLLKTTKETNKNKIVLTKKFINYDNKEEFG
jgi:hypothetical protein